MRKETNKYIEVRKETVTSYMLEDRYFFPDPAFQKIQIRPSEDSDPAALQKIQIQFVKYRYR